ncbi:MAG TPA: LytTR family DNA-binding domain-containing protein [Caulobacteraceae bacterium]|nr:LytTR family DNA-binding domain-containing protein [Caulobacteraceae bacterium]
MAASADPGEGVSATRVDRQFYLVSLAVMALIAPVLAFTRVSDLAHTGKAISIAESLTWDVTSTLAVAIILPAVMAFARRFGPDRQPPWRALLIQVVASVPFSAVHIVLMSALRSAAYRAAGAHYDVLGPIRNGLYEYRKDFISYGAIVLFYWGWRAMRGVWRTSAGAPSPAPTPLQPEPAAERREVVLEVRDGARRLYVRPDEICWVEAAGNYAELQLEGGRTLLHRASLASLEAQLQDAGFARIHRSRLVRKAAIAAVATNAAGDFTVTLRDGRAIGGSRRYRPSLGVASPA